MNYLTTNTELTKIADAIRTKGGASGEIVYPDGFVAGINAISGSEEPIPDGDTSVDWDTLEALYFVCDTTAVPEGAYMRTFPYTVGNSGQGKLEIGVMEDGAFVPKETYTNWSYEYAGYWIYGLKIPDLGKRYTVVRITAGASHITGMRFDRNGVITGCNNGFFIKIYGRAPYLTSLNLRYGNSNPSIKYFTPTLGARTDGEYGVRFSGIKTIPKETITFASSVTNMLYMFGGCSSLTTLDLSNFVTSAVTNMSQMFYGCSSLTTLDLSNFVTSAVTNMSQMFYGCSSLTTLDLSNFVTTAVTNMSQMFNGCSSLTTLDLSNWDTSKANLYGMFWNCSSLTTFTSPVWYTSIDFGGCSNLTHDSLMSIINNLATVTSTQKLTIGSTNKAKLTDDEIAIATGKGWTVA